MPKELVSKELDEFKTESGHVLKLLPVSSITLQMAAAQVEQEFREAGKLVDVPTYKVKNIAGEVIELPLDEESLEDPSDPTQTRINRSEWRRYQRVQEELAAEQGEAQLQTLLALGVECEPPDGWENDPKWLYRKIPLPKDPLDRKVAWLVHMATNDFELQVLQQQLQLIAMGEMVTPEQKALFRGRVRSAAREYVEDQFDRAFQAVGQVGSKLAVPGAEGGEGVGEES